MSLEILGAAFLGGLILNVMPCVLPVLTMKVFHLIDQGQNDSRANRLHGMAYSAGIVASFLVFAAAIIAAKASGKAVGWGMHFQNPAFTASLAALMVFFGLNSLGVFEFTVGMSGRGGEGGYGDSFVNGIVASVMATPCSAPFLGAATTVAFAADTGWGETLALFVLVGLGLAFPFALISFVPGFGKLLPRPGAWMLTFKKLMGFTLLGAAVWLFGVMLGQVTPDAANWFLGWLLVLSVSLWAVGHWAPLHAPTPRRIGVRVVATAVAVAAGFTMIDLERAASSHVDTGDAPVVLNGRINWTSFDSSRLVLEARRRRPVFVDFTADWCLNCKTNEKKAIEVDRIRGLLTETNILPMKADWTNEDDLITRQLKKLGRSGIPAYAIYLPDGSIDLLPEGFISSAQLAERLEQASRRYPKEKYRPLTEACIDGSTSAATSASGAKQLSSAAP